MSFKRTSVPFKIYLLNPSEYTSREILIVSKFKLIFSPPSFSSLKTLSELLKQIETEALEPLDKFFDPLKIKSELDFPRMDFMDCSPKTYRIASTTFDLPEPFGPTTETIGL